MVHNAGISCQTVGGGAGPDFLTKGLHFNYGRGEFALRPMLRDDGIIELQIVNVGKKDTPLPSAKEVDAFLRSNSPAVIDYLGKALDNNVAPGVARADQPQRVIEGRLIGRALQGKSTFIVTGGR